MPSFLLTVAVSYLLGSIPFGYLLVRVFRGEDVRKSGSGNIGATNVSRRSPALGALTLLLDAFKGSAAVTVGMLLSPPALLGMAFSSVPWYRNLSPPTEPFVAAWAATAALFAIVGHMFPIWLKFRGGKGVATGVGSFLMIAPKAALISVLIFAGVVLLFRYVSLGSILAVATFPFLAWLLHEYGNTSVALTLMLLASLLIVVKHSENIRRLLAGTESRFGSKST
jgi:glycerol-3-phosphate acyltransferase PlsY